MILFEEAGSGLLVDPGGFRHDREPTEITAAREIQEESTEAAGFGYEGAAC
eukprot:SAG22_NODE_97_length_20760_cov_43.302850_7_plen_51_part_00